MADHNRCEQCLTEGIAILPTRLGCSINIDSSGTADLSYPPRLMRDGYVYILDNHNEWYGFVVTQGRYFKSFTITGISGTPPYSNEPDLPYADSTCLAGDNCQSLNSFIRIPNPNNDIEKLWIAYSPVKWTKAIIDRHKNNTDNAKTLNMIEVSLSQNTKKTQEAGQYTFWKYSESKETRSGFYGSLPLEYGDLGGGITGIKYTNPLTRKHYQPYKGSEADALINTLVNFQNKNIETTGKKNIVIYANFHDTVSKLIDLNELLIQHEDSLERKYPANYKHKLEVGNIINGLESSVKSSVKDEFLLTDNEERINKLRKKKLKSFNPRAGTSEYEYEYDKDLEITSNLNIPPNEGNQLEKKAEQEADRVWRKDYEKLYKKQEMNAFLNSEAILKIEKDFKAVAKYLLRTHSEIFKSSKNLKSQMQFNYDTKDISSGIAYTETILECIGVTVNDSETVKTYVELMNKDINDLQSYILRALAYNSQSYIEAITRESSKNISWQNLDFSTSGIKLNNVLEASWSSLFGTISGELTTKIAEKSATIQKSVEVLGAPLLKVISNEASSTAISQTMYAIGLHLESPIIQLRFSGTKKQAIAGLTDVLVNQTNAPSKKSARTYARLLMHQLKVLDNVDLNANISGTVLVIDTKEANAVFDSLNKNNSSTSTAANARFQALQTSAATGHKGALAELKTAQAGLRRHNQVVDLASNEFVQIIEPKIASNSISNRLATAGTLFQTVACISLAAGIYSNSTEQGLQKAIVSESGAKLIASIGFLYGGILDHRVAMQGIKVKNPAASAATKDSLSKSISKSAGWAKRLNIGSAAIFSGFDFYHAYDEGFNKGNATLSILYTVSGAAGFGAVAAVTLFSASTSWTGIGLVLFAITIGVGFLISMLTLSPIQEWIENSIWGVDSLNLSHKADLAAYKVAIDSITKSESSDDEQSTSKRVAASDGSGNSTNNQKSTINLNTDIPDYQYMDAEDYEPLDYQDIEFDSTLSNVDLDPETRRNVELSQQRRQDEQNSEWSKNSDQDDYNLMGTPKTQQTNGVFSVLGANDGKASGAGISAKTRKELEQARQKTADQVESFIKVNDDLNIYTKKLNEQNKKLAELDSRLAELRKE